jgi:hypothetical protein
LTRPVHITNIVIRSPWRNWYHCVGNTYGTWLPGDPRGWRSRKHRYHCEGDYKCPPPPGVYEGMHQQSRERMKRDAILLNDDAKRIACDAFARKLLQKDIPISAVAITSRGYHIVGQFADRNPRHWIGLAKKHSSFILVEAGLAQRGGVWGARGLCKPINDEKHWRNATQYVLDHIQQGAAVWKAEVIHE